MAELEKLGSGERLPLAYGLLDRVAQAEMTEPVTEAQRTALRWRLAAYLANPTEPAVTSADIRQEFSVDRADGMPVAPAPSARREIIDAARTALQ